MNENLQIEQEPPLWLEFGFFNLILIGGLLPFFWIHRQIFECWICCCGNPLETFYRGNLYRIAGLLFLSIAVLPLDAWLLQRCVRPRVIHDDASFIIYLGLRISQSLSTFLLILASIALPEYKLMYGFAGLAGTVWTLSDSSRLRILCCYYLILFFLIPFLIFSRAFGCDCAKVSSVKANMHTLQTIAETYAADHHGRYPQNVEEMKTQAVKGDYWKEFTNPFTGRSGQAASYQNFSSLQYRLPTALTARPTPDYTDYLGIRIFRFPVPADKDAGQVLYQRESLTKYFVYGLDKSGSLILDKGHAFTLSNN